MAKTLPLVGTILSIIAFVGCGGDIDPCNDPSALTFFCGPTERLLTFEGCSPTADGRVRCVFPEGSLNNGAIDLVIAAKAESDIFDFVGELSAVNDYNLIEASQIPHGLELRAVATSARTLELSFVGMAMNHRSADSVSGLEFNLQPRYGLVVPNARVQARSIGISPVLIDIEFADHDAAGVDR